MAGARRVCSETPRQGLYSALRPPARNLFAGMIAGKISRARNLIDTTVDHVLKVTNRFLNLKLII